MKKLMLCVTATALIISGAVLANKPSAKSQITKTNAVALYSKRSTESKKIGTINPNNYNLAMIFHQGKWIKVGNRNNGQVGWIKKSSLPQTMDNSANSVRFRQFNTGPHGSFKQFSYRYQGNDTAHQLNPAEKKSLRRAMLTMQRNERSMRRHEVRMMNALANDSWSGYQRPMVIEPIMIIHDRAPTPPIANPSQRDPHKRTQKPMVKQNNSL